MRLAIVLLVACAFHFVLAVNHDSYKTCEQSSFCRRCRNAQPGRIVLLRTSIRVSSNSISADLINKDSKHRFSFKLEALLDNTYRVQIDEKIPLKPRYRVEHSLKAKPKLRTIKVKKLLHGDVEIRLDSKRKVRISSDPFRIDFFEHDVLSVSLNAKGLMRFEELRVKPQTPPANEDSGSWEEQFNSFVDTKPNGPEAVALDFEFPAADVLFGIPEHADSFVLKSTNGTDPYRLYNLDVFEHDIDSKMALYGSVPVLYGHGTQRTAGVFWNNAAETWVDIYTAEDGGPPAAHFMSESGIIDAFILMGPTPDHAFKQYTALTGTTNLPQLFTLAYHQSRFNYESEEDVANVTANFDLYSIPMDTMWLDIDYTDEKKYFTWDPKNFPNPLGLIKNLTDLGRHLVIIIDPHYKRDDDYFFHNVSTAQGYYVKNRHDEDFIGNCWPGPSSYVDFFNPKARSYYANQYLLSNFDTVTADVMLWNDMNEPSVFNGPEVTMPKDMVHYGNWEHRNVHNLYGHMHIMGTFEGLQKRDPKQRPFILTRAHFAGSQRYAAIWTGDNTAEWGHLQHSIKMCLSEAVAGFSFCGADVGGFFGNPDAELIERWYQTGAFLPFFRGHSVVGSERREPYLFPEKTRLIIRDAIRRRYSYLPIWYTMFYEHEVNGSPVMRPLLANYPKDKNAFHVENAFLLQDRLLVRPVLEPNVTQVDVYFPSIDGKTTGDLWYDIDTMDMYNTTGIHWIDVDADKIPVFQRGGSVLITKEDFRQTSGEMEQDPFYIYACLNRKGKAFDTLFVDDYKSYAYRRGEFYYAEVTATESGVFARRIGASSYRPRMWVEGIVVAGLRRVPKSATIVAQGVVIELNTSVLPNGNAFVIRIPSRMQLVDELNVKLNY